MPSVRSLALPAALMLGAAVAQAQSPARPDVPDTIKAPAGERVVLVAHAEGSQIYTCAASAASAPGAPGAPSAPGAEGKPQWTLKAPEAQLRSPQGTLIGHHGAGPSWKHLDGSSVTAKMVAKAPSPDSSSIPWLLLSVVSHEGKGALEHVTSIERVHTKGGQPPSGKCDPSKPNAETWIPYSADYYFFAPTAH